MGILATFASWLSSSQSRFTIQDEQTSINLTIDPEERKEDRVMRRVYGTFRQRSVDYLVPAEEVAKSFDPHILEVSTISLVEKSGVAVLLKEGVQDPLMRKLWERVYGIDLKRRVMPQIET